MSMQPVPGLLNNFTDQIKTQDVLADLSQQRLKTSVEKMLSEPEENLNYRRNKRHKRLHENSHLSHNAYSPIFQHNCLFTSLQTGLYHMLGTLIY